MDRGTVIACLAVCHGSAIRGLRYWDRFLLLAVVGRAHKSRVHKLSSCPLDRFKLPWKARFHLETGAKLLILPSLNIQADFDSAIRRFDPSRPSHLILLIKIIFSIASFGKSHSAAC
jgi:hypothetical protein